VVARSIPFDQVARWTLRVLWVALPFTAGPVLGDALAAASRPVQLVATVGMWTAWAVGVVATAVAMPLALTALRVLAPAVVVAAVAAALGGHASPLAIGWAVVTCGWAYAPGIGALWVNGPAYPNERRFLLRAPGALLFGPLAVAWAAAMAGVAVGPLLLAARVWVWGAIACVAGLPLAAVLLRGMHDLSRRWLVFVPAGIVLHDPLTVVDPVLFRRQTLARLGPAPAGALDLTQRSPGLALEIALDEEAALALVRPGRRLGESVRAARMLVTPTRPGAVIDEARRRRLPVG
jgi:hypothetical protein